MSATPLQCVNVTLQLTIYPETTIINFGCYLALFVHLR